MRKKTFKILIILGLLSGSLIYLNAQEEEKYTLEHLGFSSTSANKFLKDSEKALKAIYMANAYTKYDNIPDSYYDYLDEMPENEAYQAYEIVKFAFHQIYSDLEHFFSKFKNRKFLFSFFADKGDAQLKAFYQNYLLLVEQLQQLQLGKTSSVPKAGLEAKSKFAQLNSQNKNIDFQLIKEVIQAQIQIVKNYQKKYNKISHTVQVNFCPSISDSTSSDVCDFSLMKKL